MNKYDAELAEAEQALKNLQDERDVLSIEASVTGRFRVNASMGHSLRRHPLVNSGWRDSLEESCEHVKDKLYYYQKRFEYVTTK